MINAADRDMDTDTESDRGFEGLLVELKKVARRLDELEIPWALFAGAAAAVYGAGRPLTDVDILVPSGEVERLIKAFPDGEVLTFGGTVSVALPSIDILAGLRILDMDDRMIARLSRRHLGDYRVPVIPIEDNILLKAVWGRGLEVGKHDWEDVEAMMSRTDSLEWDYLEWRAGQITTPEQAGAILERLATIWNEKRRVGVKGELTMIADFGMAKGARITVLVDNRADMLVKSTETVKHYTEKPLLAEHGFSLLIELKDDATVLWDAGMTANTFLENVERLKVDLSTIATIAVSHGHGDHTGGMTPVLRAISESRQRFKWEKDVPLDDIMNAVKARRVPVIMHPAALRERWKIGKDGTRYGPGSPPPVAEWEAAGAAMVMSDEPVQLGRGCWTTGTVPRVTFETTGVGSGRFYRDGDRLVPDALDDDQAIVINLKDKGLLVVAGCAHAGILNTVNRAKAISGVDRVWGVLGGFHLAMADDADIARTIREMKQSAPTMVSPMHCTGFRAISRFAAGMPEEFVLGVVGTRFSF